MMVQLVEKLMHVMKIKIIVVHYVIPNVEINIKVLDLFVGKNVFKADGLMMVLLAENLVFVMKISIMTVRYVILNVGTNTKELVLFVGKNVLLMKLMMV